MHLQHAGGSDWMTGGNAGMIDELEAHGLEPRGPFPGDHIEVALCVHHEEAEALRLIRSDVPSLDGEVGAVGGLAHEQDVAVGLLHEVHFVEVYEVHGLRRTLGWEVECSRAVVLVGVAGVVLGQHRLGFVSPLVFQWGLTGPRSLPVLARLSTVRS